MRLARAEADADLALALARASNARAAADTAEKQAKGDNQAELVPPGR
jgi:hypothetical protein